MHGRGVGMHGWGMCMAGGVHGRGMHGRGACVAGGVCMAQGCVWQEKWQLQQAVHILLECILVSVSFHSL